MPSALFLNVSPISTNSRDNTELIRVEEQIYRLRGELDDRFLALEKSQSDSRIMKAFTDLVEQGKQQFNAELKALMPDIKLNESGENPGLRSFNCLWRRFALRCVT